MKSLMAVFSLLIFFLLSACGGGSNSKQPTLIENRPPVLEGFIIEIDKDQIIAPIKCYDPDGTQCSYDIALAPKNGVVEIDGDKLIYSINPGFKSDEFVVVATDPAGLSDNATISVVMKDGFCHGSDISIGNQCWADKNSIINAQYWYTDVDGSIVEHDTVDKNGWRYGALYDWFNMKNACYPGYHVPSIKEWKTALQNVKSPDELVKILKLPDAGSWSGTHFGAKDHQGYYWASDEGDSYYGIIILYRNINGIEFRGVSSFSTSTPDDGYSVRCIRD